RRSASRHWRAWTTPFTKITVGSLALNRGKFGRNHQVGALALQEPRLALQLEELLPFRIRHHGGTLAHAVGRVLLDPHMHQRVHLPALGEQVGVRLPEMTRLRNEAVLLVKIEMRIHGTRLHAIVTMIDQHARSPWLVRRRWRGARSFGAASRGVKW